MSLSLPYNCKMRLSTACLVLGAYFLAACSSSDSVPPKSDFELNESLLAKYFSQDFNNLPNYAFPEYPEHYNNHVFEMFDNNRLDNPISDKGAMLGRVLFFDPKLSRNDTTSCASCHDPAKAFGDDVQFSRGFQGDEFTSAHSMRLLNARFYPDESAFWDKRAMTLEDQVTEPIKNPIEMGFDNANGGIAALITKLEAIEYYSHLFEWVFGDAQITEKRMQFVLAQFVRSIVSVDSKFDRVFADNYNPLYPDGGIASEFIGFTEAENRGKDFFMRDESEFGGRCAVCHVPPAFGIALNTKGIGLDPDDHTVYKSPSLKNISVGGPYMHDGRFETLEEVLAHYQNDIVVNEALDPVLRDGMVALPIDMTEQDKTDLIAFLNTLTDQSIATDAKFQDPFLP